MRAFYLAVAPAIFGDISEKIRDHKLITKKTRIVVEKPIGRDLASALELNDTIGKVFKEEQIFRIDHYLGKETVQNLMALRFANALYEPLWNSAHIDHVQITVAESVGLESRAGYYDKAGALRDMVQNHILQLLCLVAMEVPSVDERGSGARRKAESAARAEADHTRQCRKADRARPVQGRRFCRRRGQGLPRGTGRRRFQHRDLRRHQGRDQQLALGRRALLHPHRQALAGRMSEIVITFKPIPHSIFDEAAGRIEANQLIIRLQPDEGVKQSLMIKDPGPGGMRLRNVSLDMTFAEAFDARNADAYERLLLDVIRNNQTLFMRRDEVEAAWRWVDPILKSWEAVGQQVQSYTAGTWGPSQAIALIERDGRTWHEVI